MVADPMQADFIIFGNADSKRAGWTKMFFLRSGLSGMTAGMMMVNRRTKVVAQYRPEPFFNGSTTISLPNSTLLNLYD
jgi:hypothetical protein